MLCVCVGDVMDVVFSVCIVRSGAYTRWSCHKPCVNCVEPSHPQQWWPDYQIIL